MEKKSATAKHEQELSKNINDLFDKCIKIPVDEGIIVAKEPRDTHNTPLEPQDEKLLEEFIKYLYIGVKRFGHNKHTNHVLYMAVRVVTRIIGQFKKENFKISKEAKKILGNGIHDFKTADNARKKHSGETVQEHKKPAIMFYNELKDIETVFDKENPHEKPIHKKAGFSEKRIKAWFNSEAVNAIITKDEDKKLRKKKWWKERPDNAYDETDIKIKLEDIWKK